MTYAAKQSGIIVSYLPEKKIGRLVDKDETSYFFHLHGVISGSPREGANVLFVKSKKPVNPGMLPVAVLIEVIRDVAGVTASVTVGSKVLGQNDGQTGVKAGE